MNEFGETEKETKKGKINIKYFTKVKISVELQIALNGFTLP